MPALLAALLIVAPQTIARWMPGDLRLAAAACRRRRRPKPSPSGGTCGRDSAGWVPITLPLKHEDGRLEAADVPDLRGGFDPELAISLLIRSQRRPVGGRTVTDFEMWLHPSADAASYELPTSSDVRRSGSSPACASALGYDGGDGTWNAAVEPRPGSRSRPRPTRRSCTSAATAPAGPT